MADHEPFIWPHDVQHKQGLLALVGERRDLCQEFLELLELARRVVDLGQRAEAVFAEEADRVLVREAQELVLDFGESVPGTKGTGCRHLSRLG